MMAQSWTVDSPALLAALAASEDVFSTTFHVLFTLNMLGVKLLLGFFSPVWDAGKDEVVTQLVRTVPRPALLRHQAAFRSDAAFNLRAQSAARCSSSRWHNAPHAIQRHRIETGAATRTGCPLRRRPRRRALAPCPP